MPSPFPAVPYQLETALLVTLRDTIRWESSLATLNSSGTYSGTLNTVPTQQAPFNALDYQRRDRELAWLDTRTAAAVVRVSLEISDVWNAGAVKPIMEGPQIAQINYSPQDASAAGLTSRVVHVKYADVPLDAIQTDRDLSTRDIVVYDTLYNACKNLFEPSPIYTAFLDAQGQPIPGSVPARTAWSFANGTESRADINTALPLNRDLFRDPDMNLADRDNQVAGYVAQLCQVLKNPFSFADRLYVAVNGLDSREVEVYSLIFPVFEAGHRYFEGDEIYYQDQCYVVFAGVGSTTDIPWQSPWAWQTTSTPRKRVWTCEPALQNRNRIVYDTETSTLKWTREGGVENHIPQLFAMSIPGLFSGQTIQTLARVPERKDGQFWRGKAAHVVPSGGTYAALYSVPDTATWKTADFVPQLTAASLTVPSSGTVFFSDPTTSRHPTLLPYHHWYRVYALVEPNSTVEIQGAANTAAVTGTLGGATFGAETQLTWDVGLPPTQWTVEFDYTNLSGSTDGFRIRADMGGQVIFDDTSPFYFTDANGDPLPNGQLATSVPFAVFPSGGKQPLTFYWTGGGGDLHIRTLRFKSEAYSAGRFHLTGTMAGSVASVDVLGINRQPDVVSWDFYAKGTPWGGYQSSDFQVKWEKDPQIPIRFHQFELLLTGSNTPTPNSQGFEPYRNDCLVRAHRSAYDSYNEALNSGPVPTFMSAGSFWGTASTERWMAFIETAEPRLRQMNNIVSGALIEGRDYQVRLEKATYEGNTILPSQIIHATNTANFSWVSDTGTVDQVGAWVKSRPSHVGRPGLAPAGVYFDTNGGTVAVAYGPERNHPQLVTLQPWMILNGYYAAQEEFWLPSAQV